MVLLWVGIGYGQDAASDTKKAVIPDFSASVRLVVLGDSTIKNLVQSYLGRELRSLKDVQLVESKEHYLVQVISGVLKNNAGDKTGVVFSGLVLRNMSAVIRARLFVCNLDSTLNPSYDLFMLVRHWIRVGDESDIQAICAKIVADFDTEELEPSRVIWRELQDQERNK